MYNPVLYVIKTENYNPCSFKTFCTIKALYKWLIE